MKNFALYHDRGNFIYQDLDKSPTVQRYVVDDVPVDEKNPRPCARCGKHPTKDGVDACIGREIPGMRSTCCGHGVEDPYFVTDGGVLIQNYGIYQLDKSPEQYPIIKVNPKHWGLPDGFRVVTDDVEVEFENEGVIWCDGDYGIEGEIAPYFLYLPDSPIGTIPAHSNIPRNVSFKESGLYEYEGQLQKLILNSAISIVQIPDIKLAESVYEHLINHKKDVHTFWTRDFHKKTGVGYVFSGEEGVSMAPLNASNAIYPVVLIAHPSPKNLEASSSKYDIFKFSTVKEDE